MHTLTHTHTHTQSAKLKRIPSVFEEDAYVLSNGLKREHEMDDQDRVAAGLGLF
jgi:hypothetical protein